jgi:hypothetical protein
VVRNHITRSSTRIWTSTKGSNSGSEWYRLSVVDEGDVVVVRECSRWLKERIVHRLVAGKCGATLLVSVVLRCVCVCVCVCEQESKSEQLREIERVRCQFHCTCPVRAATRAGSLSPVHVNTHKHTRKERERKIRNRSFREAHCHRSPNTCA